ncbi:MAG TPA: hypothetical protein VE422_08940 [Terriglobia bacterium]|nr:hypothetical protein [Terriglobia bacterium]
MRFRTKAGFLFFLAVATALALQIDVRAAIDVLWLDFDMKNIPEPKERGTSFYENLFHEQWVEGAKKDLDVPRWVRALAGNPKPAMNVNAVDEVPDSSWYTNRHHLRHMSIEELVRGPNQNGPPDFDQATVTKSKSSGVTPGMQLKDKKGDTYFIKFDPANAPDLQSGAEVISTKILYAAGYNVPENYIAYIQPDQLVIGQKLEIRDASNKRRPFTRQDLAKMLEPAARMPDGRYRVLASKMLPGIPKGPFAHIGFRRDDPNDLIPHEHRRELRGLRVIASWINHWDMKEEQSLDMYVEEHGRKFLRHYLLDFGSTLGAEYPAAYFRGREYAFDLGSVVREMFTLGFYVSAAEKQSIVLLPEVGAFTSQDFDPENWKTTYAVMAFQNMTDEDAFWATRIILSFSETEIRRIVETAEYRDPEATEWVLRTLLERRRIVADHWLRHVNPIARFSVETRPEGVALRFQDFMVDWNLADRASTEYAYQIKGHQYNSAEITTRDPVVLADRKTLSEALEKSAPDAPLAVTIRTRRVGTDRDPVTVYLFPKANGEFVVGRISRG